MENNKKISIYEIGINIGQSINILSKDEQFIKDLLDKSKQKEVTKKIVKMTQSLRIQQKRVKKVYEEAGFEIRYN